MVDTKIRELVNHIMHWIAEYSTNLDGLHHVDSSQIEYSDWWFGEH